MEPDSGGEVLEEDRTIHSNQYIQDLVNSLGAKKTDFLDSVESAVKLYISRQSFKDCLTFVAITDSGNIGSFHRPEGTITYLNCLQKFCAREKYNGQILDSYLTEGIVSRVTIKFQKFYEGNSDEISTSITRVITQDKVFLKSLSEQIFDYAKADVPKFVRNKAAALLLANLEQVFNTSIAKTSANIVNTAVTKTITASVGTPIVKKVATIVVKFVTLHFKGLIIAAFKSAAIKSAVAVLVKKYAVAAFLAAFVKIISAKLALGTTATFTWVVLPILIGYLSWEAYFLPNKLGEKVSLKIRAELDSNFDGMNRDIVNTALTDILESGVAGMAANISSEPEAKEALDALLAEASRLAGV